MTKNRIRCSITESYNSYENAVAEHVNAYFETRILLETQQSYLTWMKQLVEQSVQIYNKESRRKCSNKNL
ncbi:hypothetical protein V9L05_20235 [Bernardetia sp. Wsw4-3y2]|uniref:hypothetical protein n=1 Tax=Bernardetia sp. Wsw4-3y2 TaxID=3127471 RepID=UPI0030D26255